MDEPIQMHPLIETVFKALDQRDVAWLLLRGLDGLSAPTGDVDLLVEPDGLDVLDRVLVDHGFSAQGWALFVQRRSYVAYVATDDLWIHFDVVAEVSFGPMLEFDTSVSRSCLDRRQRRGGVPTLSGDDAFWHLLLHYELDRGEIPQKRRAAVAQAAQDASANGPLALLLDRLIPDFGSEKLLDLARSSAWGDIQRVFVEVRTAWAGSRTIRQRASLATRRGLWRVGLATRTHSRPGLAVAILGPDGSGKTTLALGLQETLGIPVRYIYGGLWRAGWLEDRFAAIPGLRLLLILFRTTVRSARTVYHRWRGRTVLLDRFTDDAHLVRADDSIRQRISAFLLLKLFPEPDLVIVLDLPGEVAFARKHEQSVALIDKWREQYRTLEGKVRELVVLDATSPADEVRREAAAAIWTCLHRRLTRSLGARDVTP
jgi:thymidylate kinase